VATPQQPTDERLGAAEAATGLRFNDRGLLALALTHRSYINENPGAGAESNERLEFLGDGIINFVAGHHLYELAPDATEGELTVRRAHVVKRETLADAARSLGLGALLLMARGEAASGGAGRPSNLANVYEALCGAILLDRGYETARSFILRTLKSEIEASGNGGAPRDPKSLLQEIIQSRGGRSPGYEVVSVSGPDHDRRFIVEVVVAGAVTGRGEGRRKIDAERAAAQDALRSLGHGAGVTGPGRHLAGGPGNTQS
jgi:ribonuclease-3